MQKIIPTLSIILFTLCSTITMGQYTSQSFIADEASSTGANATHFIYDTLVAGAGNEIPTQWVYSFNDETIGEFINISHQQAGQNGQWVRFCNVGLIPPVGTFIVEIEIQVYNSGSSLDQLINRDLIYVDVANCPGGGGFCALVDDNTVPLPPLSVELSAFTAHERNNTVELNWTTSSERDNSIFIIERSNDAMFYKAIGTKNGAGNSDFYQYYDYTDEKPMVGYNYYRLRTVDFNDIEEVTQAIPVFVRGEEFEANIFPSTFANGITIQIPGKAKADVAIYTLSGNKVFSSKGITDTYINLSHLVSGVYYVQLTDHGKVLKTEKIIRQ